MWWLEYQREEGGRQLSLPAHSRSGLPSSGWKMGPVPPTGWSIRGRREEDNYRYQYTPAQVFHLPAGRWGQFLPLAGVLEGGGRKITIVTSTLQLRSSIFRLEDGASSSYWLEYQREEGGRQLSLPAHSSSGLSSSGWKMGPVPPTGWSIRGRKITIVTSTLQLRSFIFRLEDGASSS